MFSNVLFMWLGFTLCLLVWSLTVSFVFGKRGFGKVHIIPPVVLTVAAYLIGGPSMVANILYIPMRLALGVFGIVI